MVTELATDAVIFREDLYPRVKHNPALVHRYAEALEVLPPIEVNQHSILIDGWHRWTAHRTVKAPTIRVEVTETESEAELFALSIERNSAHGFQLEEADKRSAAIRLYGAGTGLDKDRIAAVLSVSLRQVNSYLSDIDRQRREDRKKRIFDLWLACKTQAEIAEAVGISQPLVVTQVEEISKLEALPKLIKVLAEFADSDWSPPLFNIWAFAKKTNEVGHHGNSEQRILENLLYLYTEPFDIVLDPFAGGGSTIDVCQKRLRRYWASDRLPIPAREKEIRCLDIVTDLPALRWSEVALTYLDPPYWRQAAGQYSNDPEDLANMPLDQFTKALTGVVKRIAAKQSKGAIALLIQPTQWNADNREVADHVIDLVKAVGNGRLKYEYRVSCPYSTEQYNAQQVDWAKANRKLLLLTRELIIWKVG